MKEALELIWNSKIIDPLHFCKYKHHNYKIYKRDRDRKQFPLATDVEP